MLYEYIISNTYSINKSIRLSNIIPLTNWICMDYTQYDYKEKAYIIDIYQANYSEVATQ